MELQRELHIDIETYSSVDLAKCGVYKYAESPDFEILIVAYAVGDEAPQVCDWADIPEYIKELMLDKSVAKIAHNAAFERICLRAAGIDTSPEEWICTLVYAAYCGLPQSLGDLSKVLGFAPDKAKSAAGKALIRYFALPVKATKVNGGRTRNLPMHDRDKWRAFKDYCAQDVVAEQSVLYQLRRLACLPDSVLVDYALDQRINDRGVYIDERLMKQAIEADNIHKTRLIDEAKHLTGLSNPNSPTQLADWLERRTGTNINSVAKQALEEIAEGTTDETVKRVLALRRSLGKSSIKKYEAMDKYRALDGRARGLFQFYGASRTGRWAGRGIQLQNLPANRMPDLDTARQLLRDSGYDALEAWYGVDQISDILSQLIRTAFVPTSGTFTIADFSAIEARVLAWLAGERWRLEVFRSHGKIYEASASAMFGVPIDKVTKELRQKGKIAELALGYQGGIGALKTMGGVKMGLTEPEMGNIVEKWRAANPAITSYWSAIDKATKQALHKGYAEVGAVGFTVKGNTLHIELPSGRQLCYYNARFLINRFGKAAVCYEGVDPDTKRWGKVESYGGKFVENIVQAVSRDLLTFALQTLRREGLDIVMHVHDEVVVDGDVDGIDELMNELPDWAEGFPQAVSSFKSSYYKKD